MLTGPFGMLIQVSGIVRTEEESTAQLSYHHLEVEAAHCTEWFCSNTVIFSDKKGHGCSEISGIQFLFPL